MQTNMLQRWGIAFVTVLVLAATVGWSQTANAAEDDGAYPRSGFGSREMFKLECEILGGTFSDDQYGNTNCHGSGRWVQCDSNGNDCWVTPTERQLPPETSPDQGPVVAAPVDDQAGEYVSDPAAPVFARP